MEQALPWIFTLTVALAGLFAFFALWMSLRIAFADSTLEEVRAEVESETRRTLQTEKEALLEEIRDVSFEHEAGKLSDEDFAELNDKLRARAREVLIELDAAAASYRDEAEALIAERMARSGGAGADDDEGQR
jgi:hypothetical protein